MESDIETQKRNAKILITENRNLFTTEEQYRELLNKVDKMDKIDKVIDIIFLVQKTKKMNEIKSEQEIIKKDSPTSKAEENLFVLLKESKRENEFLKTENIKLKDENEKLKSENNILKSDNEKFKSQNKHIKNGITKFYKQYII